MMSNIGISYNEKVTDSIEKNLDLIMKLNDSIYLVLLTIITLLIPKKNGVRFDRISR